MLVANENVPDKLLLRGWVSKYPHGSKSRTGADPLIKFGTYWLNVLLVQMSGFQQLLFCNWIPMPDHPKV